MDLSRTTTPRNRRRPRWLAALAATVAVAFLAGGLAAPAQAAPARTTLAVAVSDYSVDAGASVTVSGTLKRGNKAVANVSVKLQKRTAGSTAWTTITTAKTNSKGKVSARVSGLGKDTEIRALSSGTSKYKAAKSSTKKVKVRQRVTITKTSESKPVTGEKITFSGTTSSGLAGKTVELQEKSGSAWTTVAAAKVSPKNVFSVETEAGSAGKATYRVHAPATASTGSATSSEKSFAVHQWFFLNDVAPADGSEWADGGMGLDTTPSTIAGVSFGRALSDVFNADNAELLASYSTWNLDGRCVAFTAKVGIDDASAEGTRAAFRGEAFTSLDHADGSDLLLEFGEAERGEEARTVSASVAGFNFLEVWATDSTEAEWAEGAEGYAVFADAKVLCGAAL
ncbi:hypothetical protein NCCP1664_08860 [Zafaria cholistanensis]|uniref:Glycosyl hydrolase family 98 putative carbohydrate-binding module domain-containing protein n=1 Tax=Zafaria cholistanensis TaxID=1682741 RepID=A0A5A7NP16_9MICC|nr:NPCBM/NEW2 domain-containing protein [Zafaria cholistanensis]GER22389.1 hypothetical protein NCCP1664_08860 [Zafaria cholistanensis]